VKLSRDSDPERFQRRVVEAAGFRSTFMGSHVAVAIGALSVGAGAVGALAIGRLAIGSARIKRLRIDELEVGRLTVADDARGAAGATAIGPKLSHVDLVVSSLETSLPFYRELLGPVGWDDIDVMEGERGEDIHYISVAGTGVSALGLREAQSQAHAAPYDRYALGVHHVCIDVPSREAVDERAAWVAADGRGSILSAPAEHDYTPGYYAVFLADPDGIKIELLHRPSYWGSVGAA
jgi:glyoxylase I family protein